MCRDCILVPLSTIIFEFIHWYLNQTTFTKVLLLKQMKQTTHQVSCQSLLNHGNFSAGLYIKQGWSRGSLQRFSSSFLQLNRSIILPFSELMEMEPRHHLVQNFLHSTFAVEQLPIHFIRVSCTPRNVTLRRVQSLFLSVMLIFDK